MYVRKPSHHYLADQLNGANNLEATFKVSSKGFPYIWFTILFAENFKHKHHSFAANVNKLLSNSKDLQCPYKNINR